MFVSLLFVQAAEAFVAADMPCNMRMSEAHQDIEVHSAHQNINTHMDKSTSGCAEHELVQLTEQKVPCECCEQNCYCPVGMAFTALVLYSAINKPLDLHIFDLPDYRLHAGKHLIALLQRPPIAI